MDIAAIGKLDESADMKILHPTKNIVLTDDKNKEMTITLFGRHSVTYRKAIREIAKEMQDKGQEQIEDNVAYAADLLSRITKDWHIQIDGKKPEFSMDAAKKLYAEYSWIRDQVDNFVHLEKEAFLSSNSKN